MLNAYLLTRLAVVQELSELLLGVCVFYWILRGTFWTLAEFTDEIGVSDIAETLSIKLRKLHHIIVALTLLGFFGSTLLPSKTDTAIMVGAEAASRLGAITKSK